MRITSSVIGSFVLFVSPNEALAAALKIACPLRLAPHLARCLGHEFQLRDLVADRHGVAADAGGEAALRRQSKLVERRVARRLFDAPFQLVLGFHLRTFGRDETKHGGLAFGQEAQRRKAAGARRIVFQEIAVDGDVVEENFGDRIVAALGDPGAGEISAAI